MASVERQIRSLSCVLSSIASIEKEDRRNLPFEAQVFGGKQPKCCKTSRPLCLAMMLFDTCIPQRPRSRREWPLWVQLYLAALFARHKQCDCASFALVGGEASLDTQQNVIVNLSRMAERSACSRSFLHEKGRRGREKKEDAKEEQTLVLCSFRWLLAYTEFLCSAENALEDMYGERGFWGIRDSR